jgi:hypothetical protein
MMRTGILKKKLGGDGEVGRGRQCHLNNLSEVRMVDKPV